MMWYRERHWIWTELDDCIMQYNTTATGEFSVGNTRSQKHAFVLRNWSFV